VDKLIIRRAAVLGAGVMGAQIAAHLANADVPVLLFDLPATAGDPNGIVAKALDGLKKLEPAPLASRDRLQHIDAANYGQHLPLLAGCDLVIEAIAEKMEWKEDLYRRIVPHLKGDAVLASNTSGLSINRLSEALPAERHSRFCGIHFFNPPRYMPLVEIIPTRDSAPAMLDALETWLTSRLGKGVVRAKDTPNFIANRIGVFSMLAVMHHTARLGLGFDEVDSLTGPKIGRPKSATFRTADVVGLDTLAHVVNTMRDTLRPSPGPLPVGDLPRRVPLLRSAAGAHRRQCPGPGSGPALGLRLGPGPLRDLASRRLERHCAGHRRRHRRRPGHGRCAAAGLGNAAYRRARY